MATLSTISNLSLDLNKEIIILGKGSSSSLICSYDTSNAYVASLNSSCVVYDKHIDFLFFNDYITIENILKHDYDLNRIKNIVCPIQLHANERVSKYTYQDVISDLIKFNIKVFTFKLQTQTIDSPENIDHNLLRCYSTATAAFHWFTHIGFKQFTTFGISSDAQYNKKFIQKNDKGINRDGNWYNQNISSCLSILKNHDCYYNFY